jgi:ParB family transcriptional regulator, chromosome partitioning protein
MSAVREKLAARFGDNVMESMGAGRAGGFTLPTAGPIPEESAKYQGCTRIKSALLIQVDRVVPDPNQPRKEFAPESLRQLADSLKERGQLQPIRARWDAAMEKWVIIAGERRWRAATQAGLPTIAAVEATAPLTEDEILEEQLIENCVREDLKPLEQARAYKALMANRGLSQHQLAERLRIAQATVAKTLALLTLPGEIQASVDAGEIGPTQAYQISRIEDPQEQVAMAREAQAGRLSRDEIEERTRAARKGRGAARGKAKRVTIRTFKTGAGPKVTVESRRALDGSSLVAALREALARAEQETSAAGEAKDEAA